MVFKPILTQKEIKLIFSEFKKELEKNGIKVEKMILFGSYAKGKIHPYSDVDICVVSPQFGKKDFEEMVEISLLAKKICLLIEVIPMNPKDLSSNKHPLAAEINKTGKEIIKKAA